MVAIVIFEVIHIPFRKALRVLFLMVKRPFVACTCHLSGTGVDAEGQTLGMEQLRDGFHAIGEFVVVDDDMTIVASALGVLPAIVQQDIIVANLLEADVDQGLGGVEEEGL
jgi:hypothetical protein